MFRLLVVLLAVVFAVDSARSQVRELRLEDQFDGLQGTFLMEDLGSGQRSIYNAEQATRWLPAGDQYQLIVALTAMQEELLSSEVQPFQATSLRQAFEKRDAEVFYALIDSLGSDVHEHYTSTSSFGRASFDDTLANCWNTPRVMTSAEQLLLFMRELYLNSGPFELGAMEAGRRLLIERQEAGTLLSGRSCEVTKDGKSSHAWFIGYIRNGEQRTVFVTGIQGPKDATEARVRSITQSILSELGLLPSLSSN